MFDGLAMMNAEELAEIVRLLGVTKGPASREARREDLPRELLYEVVSGWLARVVKLDGATPEEVERAVLEWTAAAIRVPLASELSTDDVERAIRRRIASEAASYLEPFWNIVCGLIAVGKADTIQAKLTLLEQAASTAVPSQAALRERRSSWEALCQRWLQQVPLAELEPSLHLVATRPGLGAECLTLGLALSLLDGGVSFPTERLFREIADAFGLDRKEADGLQRRVSDLYWRHHNAAFPSHPDQKDHHDPVDTAARQTVYEAGALEALATEARMRLLSSIEPEPKRSGWSRLMGSLSGMSGFFSDKLKGDARASMVRIVYHAIVKQHLVIAAATHARGRAISGSSEAVGVSRDSSLRRDEEGGGLDRVSHLPTPPLLVDASDEYAQAGFPTLKEVTSPVELEVEPPHVLAETVEQPTSTRRIRLDL